MDISFKTKKLEKIANQDKLLNKEYGFACARKITLRFGQLRAADNLFQFSRLHPNPRLHPLSGNLEGLFAIDLEHPRRLIIEPNEEPLPKDSSGGMDWVQVKAISVVRVEDNYHDR